MHSITKNTTRALSKLQNEGPVGLYVAANRRLGALDRHSFKREILVTGCGSSGTGYIAHLMNLNGIAVTHDAGLGRHGIVTNACNGKEVWIYAYGRHDIKEYVQIKIAVQEFVKVVHVIRHPLKVIGSVLKKWQEWGGLWLHVKEGLDDLDTRDPISIRNAMTYWLSWNEKIENLTEARLRFEDIRADPLPLFELIGRRCKRSSDPSSKIGRSGATWYPTWQDLDASDKDLAARTRSKSLAYGYTI